MKSLRIIVLTEEDALYLPAAVKYFLEFCEHDIEKVCVLRNPTTASFGKTLRTFVRAFGMLPLFSYAMKILPVVYDRIRHSGNSPKYSVKNTVIACNKDYEYVENINAPDVVAAIELINPDLIVAISPTQILKSEILDIPQYGCINIHSSMLPLHRGLYPVFWTMSEDAEESAVSVHYIADGIDTGDVLLQKRISIVGMQSMHEALVHSKREGVKLMLEAVARIADKTVDSFAIDCKQGSYHSFPDRPAYRKFRKAGYKLW